MHGLTAAHRHIMRLQSATKHAREKAGELVESIVTIAETAGTSFALGYWHGKAGDDKKKFEFFGVPAPLFGGIGAHLFALLGIGRGMESHLRAIGNGALAAHAFGTGTALGSKAGSVSGAYPSLSPGRVYGAGLTEEDLAEYAR